MLYYKAKSSQIYLFSVGQENKTKSLFCQKIQKEVLFAESDSEFQVELPAREVVRDGEIGSGYIGNPVV